MLDIPQATVPGGWLRFGGAILFLSLIAGCTSSGGVGVAAASPRSAAADTTQAAVASSTPAAPSASPAPADSLLAAALDPLRTGAAFETTVTINGSVIVSATGRSVGASSRSTVTTTGGSIEYIALPPKAWARQGTAAWVQVAAARAPVAPLEVLAAPLSLLATPSVGPGATFSATYPATALGLEGDPLPVTITLTGSVVTFRYEATLSGQATTSTTTIRPAPADAIDAPGT